MKKIFLFLFIISISAAAVTPQDYAKVVKDIQKAVTKGDTALFQSLFSQKKVIERVRATADPQNEQSFAGFIRGVQGNMGAIVKSISRQLQNGSFEFLHKVKRPKGEFYIFRMESDSGINYFEFMLIEEDNKVKIGDYYIYITGQYFTETMAIIYKNFEGQKNAAKINNQALMMRNIQQLMQQKKFNEALTLYNKFPDSLKKLKVMKAIKMNIAMNLDEKLYVETIEDLMKNFGDTDRGYIMLVQVDFWFLKKKYDKVLECVNGLDKHLKGDPYLEMFRMNCYFLKKDFDKSLKAAKKFADSFEAGSEVYTLPFQLAIELKDHKKAAEGLKFMYSGDFFIEGIEKEPEYNEFVASKEYKKFKKNNKHPNEK